MQADCPGPVLAYLHPALSYVLRRTRDGHVLCLCRDRLQQGYRNRLRVRERLPAVPARQQRHQGPDSQDRLPGRCCSASRRLGAVNSWENMKPGYGKSFGYKMAWLAVRSSDTDAVIDALGLAASQGASRRRAPWSSRNGDPGQGAADIANAL